MRFTSAMVAAGLTWFALTVPAAAQQLPADQKDDQEKADEEWKKAEERQGQEGQGQQPGMGGNPLDEILKLMESVEDRLVESETGEFTQAEQKRIVEAMRFEDKTSAALEELIQEVEKQQQQQGGGGQDQQQQKQKQKQQKNQQQKSKEQQEREKEQERQRQAQQQRKQQQKQQPQQDQQSEDRQRQEQARPPEAAGGDLNDPSRAAGRWGTLPSKLHQDAANASNRPPPGRWGRLIQRYRQRLAETKDD